MLIAMVLVTWSSIILALRWHTFDEPLERDITTYAVIAHEWLEGRPLYSDLWDHKPPLVHLTFALAEFIADYGRTAVFLVGVVAALVTLLGVCRAVRGLGEDRSTALWAGTFWMLLSSDPDLQANQPNTEALFNACLIWAFALLISCRPQKRTNLRTLLIAVLFACATLYKQVTVVTAAYLSAANILAAGRNSEERREAARQTGLIVAVGIIVWLAVAACFFAAGSLKDFVDAVFVYNRYYVGSVGETLREALSPQGIYPHALRKTVPLFALTFLGLILGIRRSFRSHLLALGYLLAAGTEVIILGGRFPHHHQVWLPILAVGAARGIRELQHRVPLKARLLPHLVAGGACAYLAPYAVTLFTYSAEDWSAIKYRNSIFVATEKLAEEITTILEPDESFYEWGNETGLYFATRISPPTGVFYAYPVAEGPLASRLSQRVIADLERVRPELAIVIREPLPWGEKPSPVLVWLFGHYRPLRSNVHQPVFLKYVRKGGRLDRVFATLEAEP